MSNKRKRSRKREFPNLPQDLLDDVLARLPVKSLQRFRSVCKTWDSLIAKDKYLAAQQVKYSQQRQRSSQQLKYSQQRQRSPIPKKQGLLNLFAMPMTRYDFEQRSKYYTFSYTADDDEVHFFADLLEKQLADKRFALKAYITNSCDGLFGVYSMEKFFVVNPRIRKVQELPEGGGHNCVGIEAIAGLGFDSLTGKYKVVRFFFREPEGEKPLGSVGCKVLSLGDDCSRSWRFVEDPPTEHYPGYLPVEVDSFLYWTIRTPKETGIVAMSFNVSREKFGVVKHPEGRRGFLAIVSRLQERLCVADTYCSSPLYLMDVWLLKDCMNTKWVKQYTIDLITLYEPEDQCEILLCPLMIDNGSIVFSQGCGRRDYYDPQTKRFYHTENITGVDRFCWVFTTSFYHTENITSDRFRWVFTTSYTESMIWPW